MAGTCPRSTSSWTGSFAEDQQLTFPLAADLDHSVADAYGTWGPRTRGGKTSDGVHRSTFVVAPDGTLRGAHYDVGAEGHVAELRAELVGT